MAERGEQLQFLVSKFSMIQFWFVLSKGIYPYSVSTFFFVIDSSKNRHL